MIYRYVYIILLSFVWLIKSPTAFAEGAQGGGGTVIEGQASDDYIDRNNDGLKELPSLKFASMVNHSLVVVSDPDFIKIISNIGKDNAPYKHIEGHQVILKDGKSVIKGTSHAEFRSEVYVISKSQLSEIADLQDFINDVKFGYDYITLQP